MAATEDLTLRPHGRALWRLLAGRTALPLAAIIVTVASAIGAKELQTRTAPVPPMAMVSITETSLRHEPLLGAPTDDLELSAELPESAAEEIAPARGELQIPADLLKYAADPNIRWFNGRPARPARTMLMTVTAYSPDARSCGPYADGQTATLHSVRTNGMRLAAADTKVLPYGSMLSIPGYDNDSIVPVLDCGSAIKGSRLDLLFPTHEEARKWGRKKVRVTIWEYADGQPADNPRKLR